MEGMKKIAKEGMVLVFGDKAEEIPLFDQKVYFLIIFLIIIFFFFHF